MNHEHVGRILATVNASLNLASAVLLVAARAAIKRRDARRHRRLVFAALATSATFLVSYLVRIAISGTHRYPGHGAMKAAYLAILASHTLLAATVPVLALWALWLALRRRFHAHKRLVRVAFPAWLYVSVTGVVVYLMLYHLPH